MNKDTATNDTSTVQQPDPCGCETRHPLERDGTSQAQRLLAALDTSSVSVDERSLSDLLVFASDYAKMLNYYKAENDLVKTDGDWQVFLKKDITMLIAVLSKEDIKAMRESFRFQLKELGTSADPLAPTDVLKAFIVLLKKMNGWYIDSDARTLLHMDLNVYFQSMILDGYLKLRALDTLAGLNVFGGFTLNTEWQSVADAAPAVNDPRLYSGNTTAERNASAAKALQSIFEKFSGTFQIIVNRSPAYLTKTIEEYPYHAAHMGLFITFLELFAYAQKNLNRITDRHLNFFYQEVLQLTPKKAIADKVHVIFELAKNASEPFKVAEKTLLNAGKDAKGTALVYATDDDIIVNKASVAQFKNLFIDKTDINQDASNPDFTTAVFASPVANSSDGKGLPLNKIIPKWDAFGSSQQNTTLEAHTMPDARLGFAVSSPQLFVAEGLRKISLRLTFRQALVFTGTGISLADVKNTAFYNFGLTSLKGWLKPDSTVINYSGGDVLEFVFTLSEKQAAVTAYNSKIHFGTFNTQQAVLKIELLNVNRTGSTVYWKNLYAVFSAAVLNRIEVNLDVQKMQNLVLHNEFSKIDPAKPFMPFGQQPVIGSPFYVGSNEIFFKSVKTLNLDIDWHGVPSNLSEHYSNYIYDKPTIITGSSSSSSGPDQPLRADISNSKVKANFLVLDKNTWVAGPSTPVGEFDSVSTEGTTHNQIFASADAQKHVQLKFKQLLSKRADAADVFNEQILGSTRGFLRLTLAGSGFLHDIYPMALAKQALLQANGKIPRQPYTPVIKTFSASYTSDQELNDEADQFYHLQPFGEQLFEHVPVDNEDTALHLVPQFIARTTDVTTGKPNDFMAQKAMLFIGIENLVPQQSISLLIQVIEDSGDHNAVPPEITWSYLSKNEWRDLSPQQVISDTSNGFQTSGIVELDIPDEATNDNTILPSGYHWLRAAAAEQGNINPAALSNVLNIIAQAVRASFSDHNNDPAHLASALNAGTITKLDEPLASVKGVSQPYASFGGKMAEEGNDYYRRVSERLRHKGRAITMWDYERLVLENFPSIYKVKCISHTRDVTGMPDCYLELAPGNVCLTVVSNLRNQNEVNKLQPTTSVNTRHEIKEFLRKRASKFAKIEVINPDYERIRVKCDVVYLPEYQKDKGYYDNLLVEDIIKFLSPWAFDEGADIVFGGKIHSSYIINFIEERYYVDFLSNFEMSKLQASDEEDTDSPFETAEELSASFAKSILVSAGTHLINKVS